MPHLPTVRRIVATLVVAACAPSTDSSTNSMAAATTMANEVNGAWRVVEINRTEGAAVIDPASVYLFSAPHYSIMFTNTPSPRVTFAQADSGTDAERLEAYNSFTANAGTFTLTGDTLVIRPVISKHPNYMGGGFDTYTWRVSGDSLWLTSVSNGFRWASGASPAGAPTIDRYRLVRMR